MDHLRLITLTFLFSLAFTTVQGADFPLKDGDTWVMAGDSITAQHLHSNYFEAFCFARYPHLKFAFRNSGVGGHTITSTLARYDYDVDAWKPTVVSVELGMNDQGGNTPEQYITNMGKMVERIRSGKGRPVMLTASPINSGNTMANLGGNKRLHEYAETLKTFSEKEQLPYADQFHQLIDIWGVNKPRENLANALPHLQQVAQDDSLEGVGHLRAFLADQAKAARKPVSMHGDPVHPGAPGQLMMAAALLKELGAKGFVSSVSIDASGKPVETKGCTVDNVASDNGVLSFDRLDECLPFPVPEEAAAVLPMYPAFLELSQYTLQVKGLKPGTYGLKINGVLLPTMYSERNLADGVNLTAPVYAPRTTPANAVAVQARGLLNAVAAKENTVGQWRGLSARAHAAGAAPELKDQLAELTKKVLEADEKIREAAKPQKLHFEVVPQQ